MEVFAGAHIHYAGQHVRFTPESGHKDLYETERPPLGGRSDPKRLTGLSKVKKKPRLLWAPEGKETPRTELPDRLSPKGQHLPIISKKFRQRPVSSPQALIYLLE
jgi:hypothetical protein